MLDAANLVAPELLNFLWEISYRCGDFGVPKDSYQKLKSNVRHER